MVHTGGGGHVGQGGNVGQTGQVLLTAGSKIQTKGS